MEILYDGVIAFLSAVGLATLIWSFAGYFLRSARLSIPGLMLVLPLRGEALSMEADVRELRRLQRSLPGAKLVLQDCGLSEDALALARYLAQRTENTLLISATEPLPPA